MATDTKVIPPDGLHYDADLSETVHKTVVLTVPKVVVKKRKLATPELATEAEAIVFNEHPGSATGDASLCCGVTTD